MVKYKLLQLCIFEILSNFNDRRTILSINGRESYGVTKESRISQGENALQEPQTQGITVTREQIGSYLSSLGNEGGTPAQYPPTERSWSCCMPPCPAAASAGAPCASGGSSCWTRDTPQHGQHQRVRGQQLPGWLGCREFQLTGRLSCGRDAQLEPRSEYLRLLSTARALRQERVYLLIKLFTSTGLPVHELEQVTVEAAGEGSCSSRGGDAPAPPRLPPEGAAGLRPEAGDLLRPHLCHPHRPPLRPGRGLCQHPPALPGCPGPPGKGNPRCLRKLYYTTRAEIEATVAQLVEQTHERLLEAEQAAVGWGGCQEVRGA